MRQAAADSRTALITRRARAAVDVVWAGGAVCALAWFALSMSHEGRVAAIWPANAVILARLVRLPPRRWLAYLLAGLLGNICGDMLTGDHPLAAMVLSACNTLEITTCAAIVRRFIGAKPDLSKPRQLAIYAGAACLAVGGQRIRGRRLAGAHRPSSVRAIAAGLDLRRRAWPDGGGAGADGAGPARPAVLPHPGPAAAQSRHGGRAGEHDRAGRPAAAPPVHLPDLRRPDGDRLQGRDHRRGRGAAGDRRRRSWRSGRSASGLSPGSPRSRCARRC